MAPPDATLVEKRAFTRLFYAGPSMDLLHEQYAKQGRIDDRAQVQAIHEVEIHASARRIWELLSDPTSWPDIDPKIHSVRLTSAVRTDESFDWANGRTRMRSRFAVLDPDREVTWTGSAAGVRAVHRHTLEPTVSGGIRLRSEESMAAPFLVALFPSRKLHAALVSWLDAVKVAAERA